MAGAESDRRHRRWAIYAGVAVIVFLAVNIDNCGRDFIGTRAQISEDAPEGLRPLVSDRSSEELEQAVCWAATRIGSWEFVGSSVDGRNRRLVFVRTNRLLRLRDDVVVLIEDRGSERVLTASSEARLKVGDLGRNPRNLRRLLDELRDVLAGASAEPAPDPERW